MIINWRPLQTFFINPRAAELASCLDVAAAPGSKIPSEDEDFWEEYDEYLLGKSYFDSKEFERVAFHLDKVKNKKRHFLKIYSTYLASMNIERKERKKEELIYD